MSLEKPIWGAPERNKEPILQVLKQYLGKRQYALEVGSGTGQHAVHFAQYLPHLVWQCTDQAEYLAGIAQWVTEARLPNLPQPIELDVTVPLPDLSTEQNPSGQFDVLYSANTLHIMSWETVQQFFKRMPELLLPDALVVIYGPFNDGEAYTSESNAEFDASLKARDPNMGIRDRDAVIKLAASVRLTLLDDIDMPANNRCLVFSSC